MSKFKGLTSKKGKMDIRKIGAAVIATMLVVALVIGLVPNETARVLAADKTANLDGFSATLVADPDTSEDDHIFNGTPAEDGKIWTDKSVTTGAIYGVSAGEGNFGVALSALAQTYNTVETGLSANQINIAYDVVFVLDFSGSMNERTGNNRSPYKAQAMVDALNPAIATLMESEHNRIAVVGYSGTNVNTGSATTLLELDHYGKTEREDDDIYFEYTNDQYIQTVDGVTNGRGTEIRTASKRVNGGTPTQRGIYRGMDLLQHAIENEESNANVIRIPIMVLLTDGEAGCARSDYENLTGGTSFSGSANGGFSNQDDEVGAYTILTANHAKKTLSDAYNAEAKIYTIGLGIENTSWARFMLDPSTTDATHENVDEMKGHLAEDDTYKDNYNYVEAYYGGSMSEDDLKKAFEDIVGSLDAQTQVTTSVNDPIASEESGSATGSNIVFTDYLGYKMELKGDSQYLRYRGVNYRFDKQTDNSYKFSGYDQSGNAVTGPVIVKEDKTFTLADVKFKAEWDANMECNGQKGYWKVTYSFPSALLPTYSRTNDYDSTNLEPIRMLYEVGLMDDVDLQGDSLKIGANGNLASEKNPVAQNVFHTNLIVYDEKGEAKEAMTWSEYTPAKDNPYYYKTGYTTDKKIAGTEAGYIRLDMNAVTQKMQEVEGTANITLTSINASLTNGRVTFVYNGTTYRVDMSGDRRDNAIWTGGITIPVVGETGDGKDITTDVSVYVEAVYDSGSWLSQNDNTLTVSKISIPMAAAQGKEVVLNRNQATVRDLTISAWDEVSTVVEQEVVSVYMEIKGDASTGYYVEDEKGNQIPVTQEGENYKVVLGEQTYYSHAYYKYHENIASYTDKQLGKGSIAKSLVGQLEIAQPESGITENNYQEVFVYHAANGSKWPATRVILQDGTPFGKPEDPKNPIEHVVNTINVCIDGIENGQTDIQGERMTVHFDFVIEEQKLPGGASKYALVDCYYWEEVKEEEEETYSVDMVASETPVIDEKTGHYFYDVSYTIESTHASGDGNVTQTDPHFFHSHFDSKGGQMKAHLGNNGRVAVDVETRYEKAITVQKEWYDRLGNKIDSGSVALNDVSITAGLYQVYNYTNEDNETVSSGQNGKLFKTVELNQSNNFSHTWAAGTLPKYLVDANGDYRTDKDGERVPVSYVVGEEKGADGWTLDSILTSEQDNGDLVFVLHNVPLAEFSPSVQKFWKGNNSIAPDGYKVKIQLLANGIPVTSENQNLEQIDAEHVVVATLKQEEADQDAELAVTFGGITIGEPQTVNLNDFNAADTNTAYEFTYAGEDGSGIGGKVGSGTHADSVKVTVVVSNTNGTDTKLSIQNATITYYYTVTAPDSEEKSQESVTLDTFRSQFVEDEEANTKTATFIMSYSAHQKAEVILDGSETPKAWYDKLDKWNLPMLEKDEKGNYKAIEYSIKETLLVPYEEGMDLKVVEKETVNGVEHIACEPDGNGVIVVPQADGSYRVFQSTIKHTEDYQFEVTNEEVLTTVTAEKVWVDNNNAYGTRPNSITFQLKANGEAKEEKVISPDEDGNWEVVEWKNLPVYTVSTTTTGESEEEKTVYTVEEIAYAVEETMGELPDSNYQYKTEVTADPETANHFVVTNSLYAEPMSMGVEKIWEDNDNAYQTRPENLYMVLHRGFVGESSVEIVAGADVVVLNAYEGWQAANVWTNLPRYDEQGREYIYVVKEYESLTQRSTEGVSGYEIVESESGLKDGVYKLTNRLTDGTISKTVTKVWKDAAADTRPESVTVELTGTTSEGIVDLDPTTDAETLTMTLTGTSATPWSYTWDNLPEYSNEEKIDYTIVETKVGATEVVNGVADGEGLDYAVSVQDDGEGNSFTVTNTLTGKTTVSVKKGWKNTPNGYNIPEVTFDVYNRYGGRVELNGEPVTLTVSMANNLTATSPELPKYNANGEAYYYTVEEMGVTGTDDYRINSVIEGGVTADGSFAYTATNTYVALKKDIVVTKKWDGVSGNDIPYAIVIELSRKVEDGTAEVITTTPTLEKSTDGKTWTYTYTNLPVFENDDEEKPYVYTVKEISIQAKSDSNPIAVVYDETDATKGSVGAYEVTINGLNITNKLVQETTSVTITKTWIGVTGSNIPSITVQLFQDGVEYGDEVTLTKDNIDNLGEKLSDTEWKYAFGNLPVYQQNGIIRHEYTVQEVKVGTKDVENGKAGDYTSVVNGYHITNTLGGTVTDIAGKKIWKDVAKVTERPDSITVELYSESNGKALTKVDELVVTGTKDNAEWSFTFDNNGNGYPKYDSDGNVYTYSVKEKGESNGMITIGNNDYKVAYGTDGNVHTITNTLHDVYTPDGPNPNPIKVTKIWKDDNNSQTKRPESLKITLIRKNEALVDTPFVELNASHKVNGNENIWSGTFAGTYDMYNAEGELYVYDVEEESIVDYTLQETTTEARGTAADGFTLTNVYTPGEMSITVEKIWVDNSNALNTRPDKLTLNLLQNGQPFDTVDLVAGTDDTWSITLNVPSTDAEGKLYTYTVEEPDDALDGTDYVKTSEAGLKVTNTLQGTLDVSGTKTWKNIDDEYRPESVTVELWRKAGDAEAVQMKDADGNVIEITTDADKNWKYDFGTMAKYDENGALYTYIVKETKIDGTPIEETDYMVSNGDDYDLINELKDIKVVISGKKIWVDNDNQYKMRPESITVNLLRDGVKVASVQVKAAADGTWTYEFKDLPKYDMSNGKEYVYSVEEEAVENYNSKVNGFDITNILDESKIPVPEKPAEPTAPKTSDAGATLGYSVTALFALAAAVTFFRRRRITR